MLSRYAVPYAPDSEEARIIGAYESLSFTDATIDTRREIAQSLWIAGRKIHAMRGLNAQSRRTRDYYFKQLTAMIRDVQPGIRSRGGQGDLGTREAFFVAQRFGWTLPRVIALFVQQGIWIGDRAELKERHDRKWTGEKKKYAAELKKAKRAHRRKTEVNAK